MKYDAWILLGSLAFVFLLSAIIMVLTKGQTVNNKHEIRIGMIGALMFGYIAWACVYMSQIKPFVSP
ncbi:subunit H of ATP synthase [Ordospora colligata]|uniref:Subunit H of ATP synthase n=1 Tax=Ordospora colligata OC4 TaxID=1354746 RepID=A0A0B2UIN9_9MICR|nr:subunit H of ATP synthase [Ordospora colligata OC4]KHN69104.1 subunit H of ATP synthase [Ordospora colligata OC4]TBU14559.1 subunit H of ATP synthase [Ordospora colligata]TBU14753.1 subunit H of ATP synthase [Ordospora colligata]TBU18187.1 subunit H of ATP synthase [Ordospora colligata]